MNAVAISRYHTRPRRILSGSAVICGLFLLGTLHSAGAMAAIAASVSLEDGAPTSVRPGEITTLEITLSNNDNNFALNSVAFNNNLPGALPNGLKVAGATSYSCFDPATGITSAGVGSLATSIGGQGIALSGGTIPPRDAASSTDGSCIILIPVTPGTSSGAASNYTYTIANGAVTANANGSSVSNVGSVSQSINVTALSQPRITKAFSNSVAVLGGVARTLTINVTNPNPVSLGLFSITDNFPSVGAGGAIIEVANPTNASSTCPGANIGSIVAGATSVTVNGGTLGANANCNIVVNVIARHTNSGYQAQATNTINAVSDFSNAIGIRAQSNATATVTARSPLQLTKTFTPNALAQGQNGSVTIRVTNSGSSALTIQGFTDSPIDGLGNTNPALGLKVNGPVAVSCTTGGTPGSFGVTANNVGITQTTNTTVAGGGSCTITVPILGQTMAVNTPVSYTNAIPAGAVNVGNAAIVSQAVSASILVADSLRVLKSQSISNPRPGNPVRYTITVQNWSAANLSNVLIQDTLPTGMTFLTGTIDGNNFSPVMTGAGCLNLTVNSTTGATSANLRIGTVPQRISISSPGACDVSFYAMIAPNAPAGTSTVNALPPGAVCTDNGSGFCNGGGANSGNNPVVLNPLTASKSFNPAGPLPEGIVTRMTITLNNFSVNPMTNLSVSDTLPVAGGVQMQVASPANAVTTCGSGTITAIPGSGSVTLNNGLLAARANLGAGAAGTCSLQLDVVGPAGVYANIATASATETYANGLPHTVDPVQATANFTYTSVLSSTKSFSPASVASGGRSTVTVRMNNSGPVALTNVAVTDPLPAGMVLASPVNAYTTCAGSTSITGAPGANSLVMTGATIGGSGSCELLFDVVATGSSDWINTIPAGGIEAVGTGVINQSAVSGTLAYVAGTALTVAKATNPSTLTFPGQASRLAITITNGTAAVSELSLSDYFTVDGTAGAAPNGMSLTSSPGASTTCPGGLVTAIPGGNSLAITGARLAAGASCTISAFVTATTTGGITNFIPVGAISTNQGLSNDGQASTSLTTQTNLGISKQFTPDFIKQGERSRLRITFYNATPRAATALAVIDTLPAGVEVPPGPNPSTTCTGATVSVPAVDQVQLTGGTLGAANGTQPATCFLEIDVTAAAGGSYTNQIPVGALTSQIGGIPTANSQPASAILRVGQPLVAHKAIGGFTLDAGNPSGFTTGSAFRAPGASARLVINLRNPNAIPLTELTFSDGFPAGLTVATTPAEATTCAGGQVTVKASPSATSIALTGATIAAASSCTVSVNVVSNIAGSYLNTIASGSITTLEGFKNEESTNAELIVSYPPGIGKQFAPAVIPPNGTSRLTLIFDNDNAAAITLSANFVDNLPTLPGAVLVASSPGMTSTCAGTVTAAAGSNNVRLASGASIPAGGCSISLNVTAATPGTHVNNIPAGALQTSAGNNQIPVNAELLVSIQGYVSGKVFQDNNLVPNGTFELGTDDPIAGASINLHAGPDCSGAPAQTTSTDAQGNYLFHSLASGSWSVCQPGQPAGTTNGMPSAGLITPVLGSTGSTGSASNPSAGSSQVANIVINGDGTGGAISGSPGNNFAEIVPSSIAGQVFLDMNNDGLVNGVDTGIAGQQVQLLDAGNNVITSTNTDSDGRYSFAGLQPGTYSVRQVNQPAGTSSGITTAGTVDNGGSSGTASSPAIQPSVISTIVLPPNTSSTANNFGELPNGRTISGLVFMDFDNSGTVNGLDYGIAGQVIDLVGIDLNGSPVPPRQATTLADGSYSFVGLPEGSYTISQPSQPADTSNGITTAGTTGGIATDPGTVPSAINGVDLTGSASVSAANNFAEIPNPAPDLVIAKDHTPVSFGVGSSSGYFTLTPSNIGIVDTSGTVTVTDTLPAGMTLSGAPTGTDWRCSGAAGSSSLSCNSTQVIPAGGTGAAITVPVAIASGITSSFLTNTAAVAGGGEPPGFSGNNTDEDTVGLSGVARVSGTAWADTNLDGILDQGERGLPNWRVELLLNGVLVLSTNTSSDGTYSFGNLSPGSGYEVVFRDPVVGNTWAPVANEQGIIPNQGVRDNPSGAVSSNNGNPAGAFVGATSLNGLELFDGDDIIQQSAAVDPDLIPVPKAVPTSPQWMLLLLGLLLALLAARAIPVPGSRNGGALG